MAAFDMPKDKLFTYMGISPCPDDFDKFWDDALAELDTFDPNPEFIPAEDFSCKSADCYDLFFTGTKGARIHAKFIKPKNIEGKIPAVIAGHGGSSQSGSWNRNLKFTAEGMAIARLDCRGQGGISEDTGIYKGNNTYYYYTRGLEDENSHNLYYRDVFLDSVLLTRIIMNLPYIDKEKISVIGGSQAGALSIVTAALVPEVKLALIQYPYLCDFKRGWSIEHPESYSGIRDFFKDRDPMHLKEDIYFNRLGYIDMQNFAHKINCEVLMATGLMDATCPPSTQFAFYNKLNCKKDVIFFPEYGHIYLRGWEDIAFKKLMEFNNR
ncbi:MAG: acetylxylan esterase [Clostridia bacterium]|nr:acetylxylan esterase [Clostridia bacterium]